MSILLDTHSLFWALTDQRRLSRSAVAAIARSEARSVSAASIFEIANKVRRGNWPLAAFLVREEFLVDMAESDIGFFAVSEIIAARAGLLDWPHRDPFDRLIAATALHHGMALVSKDAAFDALPGLERIW